MQITTRSLVYAALMVILTASGAVTAQAQNLGPFRQFLAFEGFYTRLQLDAGEGQNDLGLDGYGGRLWINLAPFSGPRPNIVEKTAIALFWSTTPRKDEAISTRHYGAEVDVYPLHVPIANVVDPFLSLGVGGFRVDNRDIGSISNPSTGDVPRGSRTRLAFTPGVGIRIPIPNRLQLRLDARDVIVFGSRLRGSDDTRTAHNLEFMFGLGLTF